MNKYSLMLTRQMHLNLALCAVSSIILTGCKPITSVDISGVYIRSANGVVDTLTLATNGFSQQTVTFTNGGQWTKDRTWKFSGEVVKFDEFYEAFDFAPPHDGVKIVVVIPPQPAATMVLWVKNGKLLRNPEEPIWIKRPITQKFQWPTSGRFGD